MAGIKLNIGRSKSKQVVAPQDSNRRTAPKSSDAKKSKKFLFKSNRQESKESPTRRVNEIDESDRTDFSGFTLDDGLFSGDLDKTRNIDQVSTRGTTENHRRRAAKGNRHGSWIDSTWDGGASFNFDEDNDSEDELDDSLYQLLDDDMDSPEQFKKLSLHNILVEEELSFQKSLVWNDDEKHD
jgi:hypothetical protein